MYLFPLPPYLKINEVIFTFNKQDCKDTWYYVEGVPLKFQVCVKVEEYIQLPGEPPIGTTISIGVKKNLGSGLFQKIQSENKFVPE